MKTKLYYRSILLMFAAVLLAFNLTAASKERPNVLFIAIDDLYDWIGPLQGHPQAYSPNFDRLAARGVTFLNAHANIPICMPSRTSFMTGLYPERTGVFTNGDSYFNVDPSILSIPQNSLQFSIIHKYRFSNDCVCSCDILSYRSPLLRTTSLAGIQLN